MHRTGLVALVASLAHLSLVAGAGCAPGGILDLSIYELHLPTYSGGEFDIDIEREDKIAGCNGYSDKNFFAGESSGCSSGTGKAYVQMDVCGSPSSCDCDTTGNSDHCRTELREVLPTREWDPKGPVNRLRATVRVMAADNGNRGTIIGQIHVNTDDVSAPAAKLYYSESGMLTFDVKTSIDDGEDMYTELGVIPLGEKFTYEIRYENDELSVSINDGEFQKFDTYDLNAPPCDFKVSRPPSPPLSQTALVASGPTLMCLQVGNYNQGDTPSSVRFYALEISH